MTGTLRVELDAPLPVELAVGEGTAVFVAGWCFSPAERVTGLSVTVDGRPQPLDAHGMPRLDLLRDFERSGEDPHGHAYRSGFWGFAQIEPGAVSPCELGLRAELEGGSVEEVALASIPLRPPLAPAEVAAPAGATGPLVAVCMATYDPPDDLFAKQVESLRAQTHRNWVCVISDDRSRPERFAALRRIVGDDPRFVVSCSERRLGFYRNFERALELAPREATYVAMADQDDTWHPDKLETLVGAIGEAQLVYSDARIVARDGTVLAGSFWGTRRNNHSDFFSLLVANAVTGAASMLRRDLLDHALPFPPGQWKHFHDHWLGLTALALGDIAYVDRSLYDYVQHGSATIGHEASNLMPSLRDRFASLRGGTRLRVRLWRLHYFADALRLASLAHVLRLRLGDRMPRRKRRALERYLRAGRSPAVVAYLFARGLRELLGRTETLGAEWMLAYTFLWRRLLEASVRERPQRALRLDAVPPPGLGQQSRKAGEGLPEVRGMADKIAPLELHVADVPARVNVLIPAFDLEHFFGGYIGKLNLALRLARRGLRVRVVATDPASMLPRDWERARVAVESYEGLDGFFDEVEVALGRELGGLEVSRDDRFVASTWWTAHIAHAALAELDGGRFLYLVQEHEPFTFPMSSWAALAAQSYTLPHTALFSTALLRDWFRDRRLGVYAGGSEAGDAVSAVFENAITAVAPPPAEELRGRRQRRLLFYARPEPHAARNLFELGVLGLKRALADGAFAGGWELRGIGTTALGRRLDLGDASLELLPRTGQGEYGALLREHDVGLALMYTPHPSLVPLEMAAAGLVTVTSSFANKTPEAMAAISQNLITVVPTIEGIAAGLREACEAAADVQRRVAGADVRWSRSWDESFGPALLERVTALLESS